MGKLYIIIIFIVTEYLLDLFKKKNNNSVKFNWTDLGEEWAPFIRNNNDEQYVVEYFVSQSCLYTWIGGSSNVGPSCAGSTRLISSVDYFANYSGTNLIKYHLSTFIFTLLWISVTTNWKFHKKVSFMLYALSFMLYDTAVIQVHTESQNISGVFLCTLEEGYDFEVTNPGPLMA